MGQPSEKLASKSNLGLIVYQIGEVKNLITDIGTKFDIYKRDTDKRLFDLEKFQATQTIQDSIQPKIDIQKIVLAAFALISTIVAAALGLNRGGGL